MLRSVVWGLTIFTLCREQMELIRFTGPSKRPSHPCVGTNWKSVAGIEKEAFVAKAEMANYETVESIEIML